jgi:hypothetical protein
MRAWKIATISPVTSATLARQGLRPTVEAAEATPAGLLDSILHWEREAAGLRPSADSPDTADLPPSSHG